MVSGWKQVRNDWNSSPLTRVKILLFYPNRWSWLYFTRRNRKGLFGSWRTMNIRQIIKSNCGATITCMVLITYLNSGKVRYDYKIPIFTTFATPNRRRWHCWRRNGSDKVFEYGPNHRSATARTATKISLVPMKIIWLINQRLSILSPSVYILNYGCFWDRPKKRIVLFTSWKASLFELKKEKEYSQDERVDMLIVWEIVRKEK